MDSEFTPCDMPFRRPTPKGSFTLFGVTVLAELPQLVRGLASNLFRFVESVFVCPILALRLFRLLL